MPNINCIKDVGWLSTQDAAKLIGMSPDFILDLAHTGKVAARKFGARVQIDSRSLARYVEAAEKVFGHES